MRFARTILLILFLTTTLLACQATNPSTSTPQEPVIQPNTPESTLHPDATEVLAPTLSQADTNPAVNSTQTPVLPVSQEDTNMTPVTPPDAASEKLVTVVKQHLAQQLGISADQIVLSSVKSVVWRDAGLGCPKPGVDYIQVETPGYNILLEAGGKAYTYHTDATRRFVPCNR